MVIKDVIPSTSPSAWAKLYVQYKKNLQSMITDEQKNTSNQLCKVELKEQASAYLNLPFLQAFVTNNCVNALYVFVTFVCH